MTTVGSSTDARTVNNTMRHQYRVLTDDEKADMSIVKDIGLAFLTELNRIGELPSTGRREVALARTKIEEAVMWAVKGITG